MQEVNQSIERYTRKPNSKKETETFKAQDIQLCELRLDAVPIPANLPQKVQNLVPSFASIRHGSQEMMRTGTYNIDMPQRKICFVKSGTHTLVISDDIIPTNNKVRLLPDSCFKVVVSFSTDCFKAPILDVIYLIKGDGTFSSSLPEKEEFPFVELSGSANAMCRKGNDYSLVFVPRDFA